MTNEFEEEQFGGAGTAVTGIIHMLDRMGIQQTVIVPRSDWSAPVWVSTGQQINVLWLPRNSNYFGYLGMIRTDALCRDFPEICSNNWDVIHIHAINFAPLAYTLSHGSVPILYSVYSFLRKELGDPPEVELQEQFKIQEELLMRSKCIQLISQSERKYLENRFAEFLNKTKVLPLGITVPPEHWQPGTMSEFLYVGRLLDYKGIEDLIFGLSFLKSVGRQISLNIIGKGTNYYEEYLRKLVHSLKLENWVHFLGRRSNQEVRQWMVRCKALIIPSRQEAYGLVALEGMAIGIPLIVSNAGGLAEIVPKDGALFFEAGNVIQLANALASIMDNPSLQQLLSVNGYRNAHQYEWSKLAPKYLTLLHRVLQREISTVSDRQKLT